MCRAYFNQFYEAVQARQAVSECTGRGRQNDVKMLDGKIETLYVAGPPEDRWLFWNGRVFRGKPFSVSHVDGVGASAKIHKWTYAFPGEHVDGIESWLYPIQPPH